MESACTDWVKKTVDLGSATGLQATFNNGSGTWDNNGGNNYALGTGTITVKTPPPPPAGPPPTSTTRPRAAREWSGRNLLRRQNVALRN